MRRLLILSVVATICMQMGGCPKLSLGSNDRGSRNEVAYSDQALTFDSDMEYYVSDGDNMVNGIVSNGNGISASVETKPQNPTETTTPAVAPDSIVGDWASARRNGQIISVSIYSFYADGTYAEQYIEYTHVSYNPGLFGEDQTGWQGVPMGFPYYTGTYTVQGDTVTMSCTSDTIEFFNPPIVSTMKIISLDAECGVFSTEMGGEAEYIRNFPTSDPFVEKLCDRLGIDTTP